MADTSNIGLPIMAPGQAQKHVTFNEAMDRLDGMIQLTVINSSTTTPPVSPAEGDRYIVAATATGVWVGQEGNVAIYLNSAWEFVTPQIGWLAYDAALTIHLKWNGTTWVNAFPASAGTKGVQDFQDTTTAGTPIPLTVAGTWYDLTNDGLGPLSSQTWAVPGHGPLWDSTTNTFDFTDLSVGDLLRFRIDVNAFTAGANHKVDLRLTFGPAYVYEAIIDSKNFKAATTGTDGKFFRYFAFQMKTADTRDNPAKLQMRSDAAGDTVEVIGWQIETEVY